MVLDTESERGDANQLHPRSAVGYSDGGSKVYFLVVDGRSLISDGVRTTVLADIMRYAGATDAMNVDGGGSSALCTSALGVRNKPSDGTERADGNGLFVVSSAPDDDEIAELRFSRFQPSRCLNMAFTLPSSMATTSMACSSTPTFRGYSLRCDESLGTYRDGNTFFATGSGTAMLTVYNGHQRERTTHHRGQWRCHCALNNDSIINDTYRTYRVQLESQVGETVMPLEPEALTWSSSDESIVTIDANTGVLQGVRDGEATVTGAIDDKAVTMKVTVEKPVKRVYPLTPRWT